MKKTTTSKMRVIIPANAQELLLLAEKVYQKHLNDGANSVLSILQDYNWSVEGGKITIALQKHELAKQKVKEWEKAYKERDLLLVNIYEIVKASRDLLTGMHRSNMKRLGDWGFTVNDSLAANGTANNLKMRVVIPKNPNELFSLATLVYQKHLADGINSPLTMINDYDWNIIGATISQAESYHQTAEATRAEAEMLHQERDILLPSIISIVKASRDILTGIHPKNMKRLSDWGFQVDNSVRRKKKMEN